MRVAAIDIGSNSTRLLVAEADPGAGSVRELVRDSRVTRLARGVDSSARLAPEAIEDVCAVVGDYLRIAGEHEPERLVALATSAVRDAENGDAFIAELRERFAFGARIIGGDEEARLTYLGATAGRGDQQGSTLVFDIGGGSTELVVGSGSEVGFHTSLQLGVVRHSERFLSSDPPSSEQLEALADATGGELAEARSAYEGPAPERAISVAGTPTSLAAIELGLDPYDPDAVEGYGLELPNLQRRLAMLASMPTAERRGVVGLQPDRAPTIVAGTVILVGTMRAFGLERVEVSEHDILWGSVLAAASETDG